MDKKSAYETKKYKITEVMACRKTKHLILSRPRNIRFFCDPEKCVAQLIVLSENPSLTSISNMKGRNEIMSWVF